MTGNPSFDVFKLPDEHNELRAVLRDLCEKEIAPYAADVDEKPRFPEEALKALNESGFSAVHISEEYGGQGADSVATCIVIEEVARVDASASLIPAVNKLGTMGLILSGSDELKKQVLPSVGSGEAMASYALSEREAGSDAAAMRTRARPDGDSWILNGSKAWITNGGKSTWYTVMASSDPEKGPNGISAFIVHKDDEGFTVGPPSSTSRTVASPATESSGSPARGSRRRWRHSTTPGRRSVRRRSALRRVRSMPRSPTPRTASNSVRRSATFRVCSSCWRTWP
jgi:alkylation response protein AidB-like acyl-CoA dehydrogenase